MKKLFGFGVVVLAAALVAGSASAALTGDESKCELTASKTVAKFAGKKVKCLNKCWSHLRKGDPAICEPAGSRDVDTQACIDEAEGEVRRWPAQEVHGRLPRVLLRRRLHGRCFQQDRDRREPHRHAGQRFRGGALQRRDGFRRIRANARTTPPRHADQSGGSPVEVHAEVPEERGEGKGASR